MKTRLRWFLPPLCLAMAPLLVVVGANLGLVPLRGWVIVRGMLFATAATAVVLEIFAAYSFPGAPMACIRR